jgi:leucyl/phenylalanyl-tRNA--protein transferase
LPIVRLSRALAFPPPSEAEPGGLLAVGGDLTPERLLLAYASGIFPWYDRPPVLWFSPDPRAVLPLGQLHIPRRLLRTLRQGRFRLSLDGAFRAVIRACAGAPRPGQRGTWITAEMVEAYERLHELGFAHSCEAFVDGELAGGIYGVSLGGAFFGESMFHARRDASKVALVTLAWCLEEWGFTLFDCQLPAAHLERFGARPIPRARFLAELERALAMPTRRGRWTLPEGLVERRAGAGAPDAAQPTRRPRSAQ